MPLPDVGGRPLSSILVVPSTPTAASPEVRVDQLLALAISDPRRAWPAARSLLDTRAHPDALTHHQARTHRNDRADLATRSIAHQAAGIVLRDDGQLPAALLELRAALRLARRAGPVDRVIDVRATYGASLIMAGRTRDGLIQLDEAAKVAQGGLLARVRLRRAHALSLLGRHAEALGDLQLALRNVRRHHDVLWEAHVVNNRCLVHLALGAVTRADEDATKAERLYSDLGHELEAAQAIHNRGLVALRRGGAPRGRPTG
jgi:tetratricopeptide (TPR) repeat protein